MRNKNYPPYPYTRDSTYEIPEVIVDYGEGKVKTIRGDRVNSLLQYKIYSFGGEYKSEEYGLDTPDGMDLLYRLIEEDAEELQEEVTQ